MPINNPHHFTIRARDIEKTSASFLYVFCFRAWFTPEIDFNFQLVCLHCGKN